MLGITVSYYHTQLRSISVKLTELKGAVAAKVYTPLFALRVCNEDYYQLLPHQNLRGISELYPFFVFAKVAVVVILNWIMY